MTRRLPHVLSAIAFAVLWLALCYALGQAADAQPLDAASPVIMDAAPAVSPAVPPPSIPEALDTYKAASDGAAKKLALFALVGAVVQGIIFVLKKATALGGDKAKKWLPLVALALGIPAAILGQLALGAGWMTSLTYAGGAVAVFFHQIGDLLKKKPA